MRGGSSPESPRAGQRHMVRGGSPRLRSFEVEDSMSSLAGTKDPQPAIAGDPKLATACVSRSKTSGLLPRRAARSAAGASTSAADSLSATSTMGSVGGVYQLRLPWGTTPGVFSSQHLRWKGRPV